ncbi:hypothetical protein JCM3766R1_000344 [Sporobolomyces carnicolor]
MPSTRSESAPRRSSRASELEKKKSQQHSAVEKKAKSTATKQARAVKPKVADKEQAKDKDKKDKKDATKSKKAATPAADAKNNKKDNNKAAPAAASKAKAAKPKAAPAAAPAKPAPTPRGPPKERGALPTAEEKKEIKAAKKESASAAKPDSNDKPEGGKAKKATTNGAAYEEGQVVEDITLKNDSDQEVALSSLYNESGLVIFTYPKANTPGCTTQSCNYRDARSDFESLGYKVIGLSRDSPKAQSSWKTKHEFKYDLLCDPEGQLLKKLGTTEAKKRCHFVIEKGGKLLEAKIGVKPADDAKNALEFIKSLDKKDE